MPEGHTLHRLAQDLRDGFAGRQVRACSPQGRFSDGAALLDGRVLTGAEAHGKHLFLAFGRDDRVHVHLGLYGTFRIGAGAAPAPVGQIRLRLAVPEAHADLRGPTRCELVTRDEVQDVAARLGPDPLRSGVPGEGGDPERAWARISRSRTAIAALLMDQRTVAGVGNVYRAEVLFRQGIDPYRPGRDVGRDAWEAVWADLMELMRTGVRQNRIDTVRPVHTPEAMGRPPRVDDHGGEVYVYRRAGLPCHVCGGEIRTAELAARNLFWCPGCQPR